MVIVVVVGAMKKILVLVYGMGFWVTTSTTLVNKTVFTGRLFMIRRERCGRGGVFLHGWFGGWDN